MRLARLKDGFTLIEVLLTVAIITIITAVSAPLVLAFSHSNELDVAANSLAQYLYQAQSLSRDRVHDCAWGVTINGHDLTLYCGNTYSGRDASRDVVYAISPVVTIQNNAEINYAKISGLPQSADSFTLTTTGNRIATVTVSQKGMVEY